MKTFISKLNKVLRYGLAPIGDVQGFINNLKEERHHPDYNGNPTLSLAVLKDFLQDHDDPRLAIVERNLEHKQKVPNAGYSWVHELNDDLKKRIGVAESEDYWPYYHKGMPVHYLPDGSQLEVERFHNKGIGANRIRWRIPDKDYSDDDFPIVGNFSDDERKDLLKKLNIEDTLDAK